MMSVFLIGIKVEYNLNIMYSYKSLFLEKSFGKNY